MILFFCQIVIALFSTYLFATNEPNLLSSLELLLGASYTILIFTGLKFYKKGLSFLIITLLFGLFIFSRFLLELLDLNIIPANIATRLIGYTFSENTITTTVYIYILFSTILNTTYILLANINIKEKYHSYISDVNLKKTAILLLSISTPGVIYKLAVTISSITNNGYLSFYNGIQYSAFGGAIEIISYKLYIVGCLLFFARQLSKKAFFIISIFILVPAIAFAIAGKRNELGLTILYLIWYWHSYIKPIKFNFINIITSLLFIIALSMIFQSIQNNRTGTEYAKNKNALVSFITSQGVSGVVLPYYIDYENMMNSKDYPFLLAPIFDRAYRNKQNDELLTHSNYFNHKLTHAVDSTAYYNGEGLGTSYIAEIFQYSYISLIFGSILLGLLIYLFEICKNNQVIKYLSFYIVNTLFFLPRGELFEYAYEIVLALCAFYFILILCRNKA
ncbi:TPA: O-antigen polysaccharide polymerase Wzy [Morganella morganii]|uniref:O-antigen polysaccharide polymerase Wzy n=1 Tax=Morganella morganii TaxID=582 RepID=UPI0029C29FEF|nr:O-antigen polysaccharide polymerase Wzy [Morganella morganii]